MGWKEKNLTPTQSKATEMPAGFGGELLSERTVLLASEPRAGAASQEGPALSDAHSLAGTSMGCPPPAGWGEEPKTGLCCSPSPPSPNRWGGLSTAVLSEG